jgi:hypothetical protein
MAFQREAARTPAAIGDIEIRLFSPDPTGADSAGATFWVQVKMSDGTTEVRSGNLSPHITTAQRNALLAFMATLRTQAAAEILPG